MTILRHGKVVFSGNTNDYTSSEIAAKMTGHEVILPSNDEKSTGGDTVLDIKGLKVKGDRGNLALDGLSLQIHSGEIVGLAGVSGNGQKELAEAINGIRKIEDGSIAFYGSEIGNNTPYQVIERGMGYIPEERNVEGIVPTFSIRENLVLKDIEKEPFSIRKILRRKKIDENAEKLRNALDSRSAGITTAGGSLSGGNIQKLILARELSRGAKFITAVYPTRGLDMGAVEFIHKELLKQRGEGIGILLISEELDEIINLSDRIAVIYKGQIQSVMDKKDATRSKLGILMAGVKEDE